ncbi:MAG: hypothetical protein KatS3mg115_0537 [Candidatus Poribacteria bacterium]|nr:MAG: hypothetical protein KatS3mg115_0537 [Candidatus Poribacteria bacterium]
MNADRRWWLVLTGIPLLLLILVGTRIAQEWGAFRQAQAIRREYLARREQLLQERSRLRHLVETLQNDPLTQERLIRSFGYVRPGETVYVVPREPSSSSP